MTPLVGVALAALLALAAHGGAAVLLAAIVLVQALLVPAWAGRVTAPGAATTLVVAGIAVAGADAALRVAQLRPDAASPGLGPLAGVLGLAVVLAFAAQLARRRSRPDVVASLTRAVSAAALGVLVAGWLTVPDTRAGTVAVTAGAIGCGAAALAVAVPLAGWIQLPLAAGLAAAGAVVLAGTPSAQQISGPGPLVALSVVIALVALSGAVLVGRGGPPRLTRLALPVAVLPLALAGPVLYVAAQVALG